MVSATCTPIVPPGIAAALRFNRPRSRSLRNGDELVALATASLGLLEHSPDAANVHLVVEHARLERRPFLCEQDALRPRGRGRADKRYDPEMVLGLALIDLLPPRLADARVLRHVDAGPRAVDA